MSGRCPSRAVSRDVAAGWLSDQWGHMPKAREGLVSVELFQREKELLVEPIIAGEDRINIGPRR
jgi:hypothetical protein